MGKVCERPKLALQPMERIRVMENLQGEPRLLIAIEYLVDGAEAAMSNLALDNESFVPGERVNRRQHRRCRGHLATFRLLSCAAGRRAVVPPGAEQLCRQTTYLGKRLSIRGFVPGKRFIVR